MITPFSVPRCHICNQFLEGFRIGADDVMVRKCSCLFSEYHCSSIKFYFNIRDGEEVLLASSFLVIDSVYHYLIDNKYNRSETIIYSFPNSFPRERTAKINISLVDWDFYSSLKEQLQVVLTFA